MIHRILILSLFFTISFGSLLAQRGWELGAGVGVTYYFGDLNTRFNLSKPGLAAGMTARYNFNNRLCLKFAGTYGNIGADDANSANVFEQRRNLRFKSSILDGSAHFELNFLPYIHGSRDQFFTPYMFGGFNVFKFNPKGKYKDNWYELAPLGTEGQFRGEEYYTTQVGLVYGGGFKFDIARDWSINIEISSRKLFTDYLDDVSTTYYGFRDLERLRGELVANLADPSLPDADGLKFGIKGRQRGNSSTKDMYIFSTVSILYYFGTISCPEFP